jgi:hypothetical protein
VTALRALLAGIVDYAGLFPPSALDMPTAVRNYALYRTEDEAWMLGRFVLPIARLHEFSDALRTIGGDANGEWKLAALLGADVAADFDRAKSFVAANAGRASIDVIEGKLGSVAAIDDAAERATDFELFVELPIDDDPKTLIEAIKASGVNAKVRTGGVTAAAIPSAANVVRFMRRCIETKVTFKATAGLHHPLRADHRLTYASDAPRGMMYGFLNVFLAAAFLEFGMPDDDATTLLLEDDPSALDTVDASISWRGRRLTAAQIRVARDVVATSFGSCSFREPVDDLHQLSILR